MMARHPVLLYVLALALLPVTLVLAAVIWVWGTLRDRGGWS